jgi:hypothetical protein
VIDVKETKREHPVQSTLHPFTLPPPLSFRTNTVGRFKHYGGHKKTFNTLQMQKADTQ